MKYIRILVIAALLSVSFNSYSFAQSNQKGKQQNNQNDTPEAFVKIFSSYVGGLSDAQKSKIAEIFKKVKSENDADWAKRPKAESLDAAKWASEHSKRCKEREEKEKQAIRALLNDKQKKQFENAEQKIFSS